MATVQVLPETTSTAASDRKRTIRGYIVFGFTVAVILLLAYFMRDVLMLLYVSALFAVVLRPLINAMTHIRIGKWHPGHGIAIALLLLSVVAAAALFFAFAVPPVLRDVQSLVTEMPTSGPQLVNKLHRVPLMSHLNLAGLNTKLQGFASNFVEYLFHSISGWAGKLADIGAVVFLTHLLHARRR